MGKSETYKNSPFIFSADAFNTGTSRGKSKITSSTEYIKGKRIWKNNAKNSVKLNSGESPTGKLERKIAIEVSKAEARQRVLIASQIHDTLIQDLVAIKMKCRMIKNNFINGEDYKTDEIISIIDKCITDSRKLVIDLHDPELFKDGFVSAIHKLARKVGTGNNLKIHITVSSPSIQIHSELLTPLYHWIRELLINITKHARAKYVDIHIMKGENQLLVEVIDDGIGINKTRNENLNRNNGGFGLASIKERISQFGGRFEIHNLPEGGTQALLILPVSGNE